MYTRNKEILSVRCSKCALNSPIKDRNSWPVCQFTRMMSSNKTKHDNMESIKCGMTEERESERKLQLTINQQHQPIKKQNHTALEITADISMNKCYTII